MNALKKLLSVLLVACMALSVCAVSFAEGTEALPRVMAMKGPTAMGLSKLMTDEAQAMMDSAGCGDTAITWGNQPLDTVEAIMQAAGLR